MNLTIDTAVIGPKAVTASGATSNAVECRMKIEGGGVTVWVPAMGWKGANVLGMLWTVSLDIPANPPNPGTYTVYAREAGGGGKEVSKVAA